MLSWSGCWPTWRRSTTRSGYSTPKISLARIEARQLRKPYGFANPGHIATRAMLSALRLAERLVTSALITTQVLADTGGNTEDARLWELATTRVNKILRTQRRRGVARSRPGEGQQLLWEVVG